MNLQTVRLDDAAQQPWKNGGGSTRELLVWPPQSGAGWVMRISVAEIERDGPFSAFEGIERWFCVLQGAGVVLGFAQRELICKADDQPLQFDGALAPSCRLVDGPTQDLNVMVKRQLGKGDVRTAALPWTSAATWRGLYTACDCMLQRDGHTQALAANTLAWTQGGAGERWSLVDVGKAARAWWIGFAELAQ